MELKGKRCAVKPVIDHVDFHSKNACLSATRKKLILDHLNICCLIYILSKRSISLYNNVTLQNLYFVYIDSEFVYTK